MQPTADSILQWPTIAKIIIYHNSDSEPFTYFLSIFVHDKLQGGCDFPRGKSYLKIFTFMIFSLFLNIEESLKMVKELL